MKSWIPLTGAKYKDQCPVEDKIPIYLIVGGAVGVFRNLISLCQRATKSNNDEDEDEKKKRPFEGILDCFLFIWFICGNVWIYKNYKPDFTDSGSEEYCNQTLYLFAFWLTTSTYILAGVMCCCVCCVGVCAAIFNADEWNLKCYPYGQECATEVYKDIM